MKTKTLGFAFRPVREALAQAAQHSVLLAFALFSVYLERITYHDQTMFGGHRC